jgi:hypothetical protein
MTAHSAFPKPDDFHAMGVRVMCNGHDLFTARTLNDAADAVQYLKALCAVQDKGLTATIPANPTDQIAATTATRGDIASHEGDATIPAVAPDAQRYDWREDLERLTGDAGLVDRRSTPFCFDRLAAYIERLEAKAAKYDSLVLPEWQEQFDALLAEHEVYPFLNRTAWQAAYDNAERVIHGE